MKGPRPLSDDEIMRMSDLAKTFAAAIVHAGIDHGAEVECVQPWAGTGRKFRADFCWPAHKLAVEIDGGTWSGGRHTRGSGFTRDCDKQNLLVANGWRQLRFTRDHVMDGRALDMVEAVLG